MSCFFCVVLYGVVCGLCSVLWVFRGFVGYNLLLCDVARSPKVSFKL